MPMVPARYLDSLVHPEAKLVFQSHDRTHSCVVVRNRPRSSQWRLTLYEAPALRRLTVKGTTFLYNTREEAIHQAIVEQECGQLVELLLPLYALAGEDAPAVPLAPQRPEVG